MSLPSFHRREAAPAPPARITLRRRLLGRGSRLRAAGVAAGLLGLGLASVQPAHAATKTWDGSIADWYSDPTHWSPSGFPAAGDDAQNLFTNAAMTLGNDATVNSFFSNSAFTLNGGTFSGNKANAASTLQVNNIFTLNGGQVNNFTIQAGTQQAGQPAPSVVVNNASNSLSNTIVNANVDMTQAGGGAFLRLFNTNTINGAITLGTLNNNGSYGLRLNNGATLVIGGTGTLQGFGVVSEETSASTLTSSGLVNANSNGNTLNLSQSIFNNNMGATAEATGGGLLSLNNTTNSSGMVKAVGAGSVVGITGTFTGTGTAAQGNLITASGGGQVQVNGASLLGTINTTSGTALVIGNNDNRLNGTTVNGNLDMTQAGGGAFLRLLGTDTVNGAITLGTLNNNGSYGLRLNNGATLLLSGGSSLTGFGVVSEEAAASTLTSSGLVNANSNGNTLGFTQAIFNNSMGATAEAMGGGLLSLNNTTNSSGAVKAVGAGSVVGITGTFTGTGTAAQGNLITASGGGQVQVNGASLLGTINTTSGTALVIGNNDNRLNGTTVNGNLDMTQAGGGAFLRLLGTDTVNGAITLGTLNNNGSYGLRLNNGATLLLNGGSSSLTGFGVVSEEAAASTLTNNGLVNANSFLNGSSNTLNFTQSVFNNNGTAEATGGGTLSLNNATNNSAGATIAATGKSSTGVGSVVAITGTFTGSGNNLITASGGGQVQVNGANLLGTINTDAGTALLFNGSGGNSLTNTAVNGNLNVAEADAGSFLRLLGTDTVNGAITLGTLNNNGSYGLRLNNGATLLLSGGSSLTGFGVVSEEAAASTLTNNGLVNANSSGNTLGFTQAIFNNSMGATAEATGGGLLSLNNTTNSSGAVKAVGAGSVVGITGTFTGTGTAAQGNLITASGGGQVQVNGANLLGTINTDAGTALLFNGSGGNSLTNTTVNGNLNVAEADAGSFLRLFGTDTVNGAITLGTANQNGSYGLRLNNGATLVIGGGGSLTGFGVVSEETAASTLTNNGLVNANASGLTLTMGQSTFNNSGTAEATGGGLLSLNNTTNNSGMVKAVGAGSVVGITGTFTGTGTAAQGNLITASGGGQVQVNGANLLGTINTDAGTALLFNGSGGNSLTNTTVNGNLNVAEADAGSFLRLFGTDTVNGAITLGTANQNGSYGLRLNNGATLVIGGTGTLQGFGVVSEETAASTVTNSGTINANTVGGNVLTFNQANFNNASTGTTNVANGATLTVNSANATNSGAVSVIQGGTVNFSNGLTQTAGSTNVFGTLNASETVKGGVLEGFGKVVGNVTNTGGTVQSTTPTGLVIQGDFTQTGGGALDAFFGNNFHDLLTVTGQATLAGTLGVFDLDSSQPAGMAAAGSQFTFLDYGTLVATGTSGGFTQYFSNEIPIDNNTGLIAGSNGFTYQLINNTTNGTLDLKVIKAGSPVPEASTTVSFGLLLALGLGGAVIARRRKKA